MALWTTADRDAIKAAILIAVVEGVASVTIGGETVQARSLKDLREMLAEVQADLASETDALGLTFRQLVPPGCG